ncbi:MAG: 50S ribosomal protein L32 [Candidatus Curtissbacteria bacterium]
MTPLPKKKHAKARTRTRKAAITLRLPSLIMCPNCKGLRFPHRACSNCGFYKEILRSSSVGTAGLKEKKSLVPQAGGVNEKEERS